MYYVTCLSDDSTARVFATCKAFDTMPDADRYAATVAPSRFPRALAHDSAEVLALHLADAERSCDVYRGAWESAEDERNRLARHLHAADADRAAMLAVLRDVAALLPVAGRMHPKDLHALQTRVCAIVAAREEG